MCICGSLCPEFLRPRCNPTSQPTPRLLRGSPSDRLALSHCDASPDTATADRSALTAPASAHPAGRPSSGSLQSSAHCAHAPRSLRAPTRSAPGSPRANASPFPTRCGSAALRRTPLAPLSESCPVSVLAVLPPLRLAGNTNSIDRPGPDQSSVSVEKNSSSPLPLQC